MSTIKMPSGTGPVAHATGTVPSAHATGTVPVGTVPVSTVPVGTVPVSTVPVGTVPQAMAELTALILEQLAGDCVINRGGFCSTHNKQDCLAPKIKKFIYTLGIR